MNLATIFSQKASKSDATNRIAYLGEAHDLEKLNGDEVSVVLGQLIIMNLDDAPQEESNTFIPQPHRHSRRRDFSIAALQQQPTLLYSSIHPALAEHIASHSSRQKFVLAVDAMMFLAGKYSSIETLLICSGYEAFDQTYFDTYLFRHGQLVRITESILKPVTHVRYAVDVKQQFDEVLVEYPEALILWTPPLSPLEIQDYPIESVSADFYLHKCPAVTQDGKTKPPSPKIPVAVTAAIIALCLGVGALDLAALAAKRTRYDELTKDNTGSIPTAALEILQARAKWQHETELNTPNVILAPANRLLSAVAQNPDWRLSSISLSTQRGTEVATPPVAPSLETAPLSIVLSAPLQTDVSATDQAHPIVATLNQKTLTNLIVRQQGISTVAEPGRLRVTIDVDNKP